MKKPTIALALAISVFAACSKDDDNNTPGANMQNLTSSAWRYDTAGIDADGNGEIDSALPPGLIQSCDRDNTILFNTDGSGVVNEGATKCNQTAPQTVNFTWNFNNAQNEINFSDTIFNGLTGAVRIRTINQTTLVLSKEVNAGLPIPIPIVVRMKH